MKLTIGLVFRVLAVVLLVFVCSCGQYLGSSGGKGEKVKAVVLTGGHGFAKELFFAMFKTFIIF